MDYLERTRTMPGIAAPLAAILMNNPNQLAGLQQWPDPQLQNRHNIIVLESQQHHLPIQPLGLHPAPTNTQVMRTGGHDWVVSITDQDPLFHDRDGFPIPSQCLQDLKRIQGAGVDFDRIYVAHELPAGTVPNDGSVTPAMVTPGPSFKARAQAERRGRLAQTAIGMATLPLVGAGLLAVTVGSAASSALVVGSALAGLDPIVFGVNLDRSKQIGAWYYLTHWAYE